MSRPENSPESWVAIGEEYFVSSSFETDAALSDFPDWSSGSAVASGSIYYFEGRDYEAALPATAAENVVNPRACRQSFNAELAERWLDLGPSNGFRCTDGSAATATRATGSIQMTIAGDAAANRVELWALYQCASVEVVVTAGEMMPNSAFKSSVISWVLGDSVTRSWALNALTVTHADHATADGDLYRELMGFVAGTDYELSVETTCDAADEWEIEVQPSGGGAAIGSSTTQTGSGTHSITWTATAPAQRVVIRLPIGTEDITLNSVSVQQDGYTQQTLSRTLQDATTGVCLRNVVLSHPRVSAPRYDITLTAPHAAATLAVGLVSAGDAVEIGCTHTEVEVGGESFSRLPLDEYGNARSVRKRRSKVFQATVQLPGSTGDVVDQVLHELEGREVSFDFNAPNTEIARLQVHGWAETWSTVVTGLSDLDTLQIGMRSLVETIRHET